MTTIRNTLTCALAAALLTTGCGHQSTDLSQGVYTLRFDKTQDTCTPARAGGDFGTVRVEQLGGMAFAEYPSIFSPGPVRQASVPLSEGMRTEGTTGGSSWAGVLTHDGVEVERVEEKSFELGYSYSIEGLANIPAGETRPEGYPEADCEVRGRLVYTLKEECPVRCELVRDSETLPLQTRCACP
ncbi:hypothetical protein [Archangium lipolyticum]|uniref:hypothetical protein n=1 Tax=Archangium lipolyticum TaxID=2970465 RepID=UPI002149E86D|nr:hypothetical protein [Archangium lipolyticum]